MVNRKKKGAKPGWRFQDPEISKTESTTNVISSPAELSPSDLAKRSYLSLNLLSKFDENKIELLMSSEAFQTFCGGAQIHRSTQILQAPFTVSTIQDYES